MESLLESVWTQGGAVGLLVVSGWVVAFFINKERIQANKSRDQLVNKVIDFMKEQKELTEKIADALEMKEILREEIARIRDGKNGKT